MDAESLLWNVRCFPPRGFPSNVLTLIREDPFFNTSLEGNDHYSVLLLKNTRSDFARFYRFLYEGAWFSIFEHGLAAAPPPPSADIATGALMPTAIHHPS